ncbi:NnrS family protein [Thioalkalivibrio sp. ALM2T]|uniref:NnrS family protein n=1 Tax=Thioalkalivibrio sp. ALM2T TaxID=1158184 RepID=UPI000366C05D
MLELNIEEPGQYRFALSHLGFRPFFLLAGLYAVLVVGLWTWLYPFNMAALPTAAFGGPFAWHGHTLIFGYAMAVVAGFLLTAVRNWTGIQTTHGPALLVLAGLWLGGRVAALFGDPGLVAMALFDLGFTLWLLAALARPVWKTRQWAQLAVIGKIALLGASNGLFYLGAFDLLDGGQRLGLYSGVYLVLSLILMMGRRVIPFFIERGLDGAFTPVNRDWLDRLALVLLLAFWLVEVFLPWAPVAAGLAAGLAVAHGMRWAGWHTPALWGKPLLWVLMMAYGWIVVGFALRAVAEFTPLSPMVALHAFTYGGIGMMTLGMMTRVALGHTGRNVFDPPRVLGLLFGLLAIGALVRVAGPLLGPALTASWISASQFLWIAAFAGFLWVYAPMLVKPRIDGRYG